MAKSAEMSPVTPAAQNLVEFWILSRRLGITHVSRKDAFWREYDRRKAALAPLNERRARVGEPAIGVQIQECQPSGRQQVSFGHGLTYVVVDPSVEPRFVAELRNMPDCDDKIEVHESGDFPLTLSEFEALSLAKKQCAGRISTERWLDLERAAVQPRKAVIAALLERNARNVPSHARGPDGVSIDAATTSNE